MERPQPVGREAATHPLVLLDGGGPAPRPGTAARAREPELIRVCLVCGAELEDRACKLVCRCGYFLSCSDYL